MRILIGDALVFARATVFARAHAFARPLLFAFALAFAPAALAAQGPRAARASGAARGPRLSGVVRDERGAPVAGAQVSLLAASSVVARAETDAAGKFDLDARSFEGKGGAGQFSVRVHAGGFADAERKLSGGGPGAVALDFTLAAAGVSERVTVAATRAEARLDETAASVALLSERDVETTAALRLDDALRQTVGFQLFRRAGSRAANPTTQGVSLRGTGASGASRALVFADGVPLNDPFGGWVYWDRVPRAEVAGVEVLRGGASSLYGGGALGGVVNLKTRRAAAGALSLEASYGNERTPDASLFASASRAGWSASVGAELFATRGYVLVDERERGRVDVAAASRNSSVDLTLERRIASAGRAFARGSLFGESRANGTPLQFNRTHARQLSAGLDAQPAALGSFAVRAYANAQVLDQSFTAVAPDRESEALTRVQRVPAQGVGFSAQWSRALGARHAFVAGADAREVRGASDEIVFAGGRAASLVGAGGRERDAGAFLEDVARFGARLILTGGIRFDRWRDYGAASTARALRGGARTSVAEFPERTESAVSPRLSALYKLSARAALTASGYRAFRQPTLNELYRSFRVGDVLTLANENLRAERLAGGEVGVSATPVERKLSVRAAFFWTEITRPVANVTLFVTPSLTTRQRQNLGRTRARGAEVEAEARPGRHWSASGGYLFVEPTVVEFPASAALEGLSVPQVARQQLAFRVLYDDPSRVTAGLQGRASGAQFEDDQNRLRLAPYFTLDAYAARRLARGFELFAAAENLLNRRYETGRTPVRTLGPPLVARFGFRVRLGAR
ncbi:MAG TPA: TonB-dependent receptor [Pyrinomonadaceae bacterium]